VLRVGQPTTASRAGAWGALALILARSRAARPAGGSRLPNPEHSVTSVAKLLGVSPGTLYNHIPLVSLVDGIAVGAASDGPGLCGWPGTPPGVGTHGPAQAGRLPATRVLARTTWASRGDDRPGAAGRPPGRRKLMNRRHARSVLQVTTVYLAGSPRPHRDYRGGAQAALSGSPRRESAAPYAARAAC
jgi:hypothetical protein